MLASAPAASTLAGYVAVTAEDGLVAARFEGNRGGLAAAGTDDRSSLCRSLAIAGSTVVILLCRTAWLASFRGGETAFLEERLIGSGEDEVLSAVAAC